MHLNLHAKCRFSRFNLKLFKKKKKRGSLKFWKHISTNKDETNDYRLITKLTVYNSEHCVANCTEAENESKHKKATATCCNLYSVAASKYDS